MIPKYRAWAKKEKLMGNVSMLRFSNVQHMQVRFRVIDNDKMVDIWSALDDDGFGTCVLMQSTGLKDKNGVEIFEGDIVHYQSVATFKKDWYKKIARRGSALVMMSFDERLIDNSEYFNLMAIDERLEVIGNIYENPELLEVEK